MVRFLSFRPRMLRPLLFCGCALSLTLVNLRADEAPLLRTADAVQEAFVRVARQSRLSVVTIYAERTAGPNANDESDDLPQDEPSPLVPRDPLQRQTGLGTGMIVSNNGDILTNYHVVKDAAVIRIIFDSDADKPARPTAHLVAFDEESDLAVVRLTSRNTIPTLTPVTFGDSDKVRIGEWALAVGAPFDQAQSVTVGVISAMGRHLDKNNRLSLQDYIQTDASINPGNSGGPLLNLSGEVIGINTAILSPSRFNVGIGFAVPSNTIRQYLPLLISGKGVARGFLGIQYAALEPEVAKALGVAGGMAIGALSQRDGQYIGPAYEAGIRAGDIITHVDGRAVTQSDDFRRAIAGATPGTVLKFTLFRPGAEAKTQEISLTLGDWNVQNSPPPTTVPLPLPPPTISPLGLKVEEATKLSIEQRKLFGLDTQSRDLVITEVVPSSAADDAELRRGQRVVRLRINDGHWQTPADAKAFALLVKSLPNGSKVLFQLRDRNELILYKLVTQVSPS